MIKKFLLLFLGICFISGCAYTTKSMTPAGAESIYIPIFRNDTYKPSKTSKTFRRDIENIVTNDVLKAFLKDGSLKVINKNKADLMLEGRVTHYSKSPLRYSSVDMDAIDEYRVSISVNLKLTDLKTGEIVWENETIARENDYYVGGASISSEESALIQASREIAKDILIQVVEAW